MARGNVLVKAAQKRRDTEKKANAARISTKFAEKHAHLHKTNVNAAGRHRLKSTKFDLGNPTEVGGSLGLTIHEEDAPEPPLKKTKKERFQEVIDEKRAERESRKALRQENEQSVELIDKSFDDISHLLHRRQREVAAPQRQEVNPLQERRGGRQFDLTSTGLVPIVSSNTSMTAADETLLNKIRKTAPRQVDTAPPDEFDTLLYRFRLAPRSAVASTPLDTDEAPESYAALMDAVVAQRAEAPEIDVTPQELTRREWLQQGGDAVPFIDEGADYSDEAEEEEEMEDEGRIGAQNDHPLDRLLVELASTLSKSTSDERERIFDGVRRFQRLSRGCATHAVRAMRLLLVDVYTALSREGKEHSTNGEHKVGGWLSPFHAAVLLIALRCFPAAEFRHPVGSPATIVAAAALRAWRLGTPTAAHGAVCVAAVLTDAVVRGGRWVAEPLSAALSVMGLVVRDDAFEEARKKDVAMPAMLSRVEDVLLDPREYVDGGEVVAFAYANGVTVSQLLETAIRIVETYCEEYGSSPSFTAAIADPFYCVYGILKTSIPSDCSLQQRLQKCAATVDDAVRKCISERSALAMRSFRPRPLRLFDPQLFDSTTAVSEHRALKRKVRDDHKRLVREIKLDSTLDLQKRESEKLQVDQVKTKKLHSLMNELQRQQHTMKTVDLHLLKKRSKQKSRISGSAGPPKEGKQ